MIRALRHSLVVPTTLNRVSTRYILDFRHNLMQKLGGSQNSSLQHKRQRQDLKSVTLKWCKTLEDSGVQDVRLSVKCIIEKVLGKHYCRSKDCSISLTQLKAIEEMCQRRANREPLQYVIEEWDFRYLTLKMKPPVLIPRPETEELVELVNTQIKSRKKFRFLDVGCGSGAISIALVQENEGVTGVAIDVSPTAVDLTHTNSTKYNVQDCLTLYTCPIEKLTSLTTEKFDAIISNPPYIPSNDMQNLQPEVLTYEDKQALWGGPDGMGVIRSILVLAPSLLKQNGSIWLETDLSHPPLLGTWISSMPHLGLILASVYKDFTGRQRFCHIVFKGLEDNGTDLSS